MPEPDFVRGRILLALQQLDARGVLKGAIRRYGGSVGTQMIMDLDRIGMSKDEREQTYKLADHPGSRVFDWIKRLEKNGIEGERGSKALNRRLRDLSTGRFPVAVKDTGEFDKWGTVTSRTTMSFIWAVSDFEKRHMNGIPRAALQKWVREELGLGDDIIAPTIDKLAEKQYFLIEDPSLIGDRNGKYIKTGERAVYEKHYLYLLGRLFENDRKRIRLPDLETHLRRLQSES